MAHPRATTLTDEFVFLDATATLEGIISTIESLESSAANDGLGAGGSGSVHSDSGSGTDYNPESGGFPPKPLATAAEQSDEDESGIAGNRVAAAEDASVPDYRCPAADARQPAMTTAAITSLAAPDDTADGAVAPHKKDLASDGAAATLAAKPAKRPRSPSFVAAANAEAATVLEAGTSTAAAIKPPRRRRSTSLPPAAGGKALPQGAKSKRGKSAAATNPGRLQPYESCMVAGADAAAMPPSLVDDVDAKKTSRRSASMPDLQAALSSDVGVQVPDDVGIGGAAGGSDIRKYNAPTAVKKPVGRPKGKRSTVSVAGGTLTATISPAGAAGDGNGSSVIVGIEASGGAVGGSEMQQDGIPVPAKRRVRQPRRKRVAIVSGDGNLAATIPSVDATDGGDQVSLPRGTDAGGSNGGGKASQKGVQAAAKKLGRQPRRVSVVDADGNSAASVVSAEPADAVKPRSKSRPVAKADAAIIPSAGSAVDGKMASAPVGIYIGGVTTGNLMQQETNLAPAKKSVRKQRSKSRPVAQADGSLKAVVRSAGSAVDGQMASAPVGSEMQQETNLAHAKKSVRQPPRKSKAMASRDGNLAAAISTVGDAAGGNEVPQEGRLTSEKKPVQQPRRKSKSIASSGGNLASAVPSVGMAANTKSQDEVPTAAKKRGRPSQSSVGSGAIANAAATEVSAGQAIGDTIARRSKSFGGACPKRTVPEGVVHQDSEPATKKPRGRPRLSTRPTIDATKECASETGASDVARARKSRVSCLLPSIGASTFTPDAAMPDDQEAVAKKRCRPTNRPSVASAACDVAPTGDAQVGTAGTGTGTRCRNSMAAFNSNPGSFGPSSSRRQSMAPLHTDDDEMQDEPTKRPYRRKTKEQLAELGIIYDTTSNLTDAQYAEVAQRTGLTVADVKKWFYGRQYRESRKDRIECP